MKTINVDRLAALRSIHAISVCLFLVVGMTSRVLALEKMRPQIELNASGQSIVVHLDFRNIEDQEWSRLLSQPDRIYEAGYGLAGQAGDPALPQFTELIPISALTTPTINILDYSRHSISIATLKQTPRGRRETDTAQLIQIMSGLVATW